MSSELSGRASAPFMVRKGRPSMFTPEIAARLVFIMRQGNFIETAAACIGVNVKVVRNWRRRGVRESRAFLRGEQQPFVWALALNGWGEWPNARALLEFLAVIVTLTDPVQWVLAEREWFALFAECMTLAEGEAEARSLGFIQKASAENPQAAMWFLSRRYPDRWGQKTDVKVSGDGGGPVGVVILPAEDPNG